MLLRERFLVAGGAGLLTAAAFTFAPSGSTFAGWSDTAVVNATVGAGVWATDSAEPPAECGDLSRFGTPPKRDDMVVYGTQGNDRIVVAKGNHPQIVMGLGGDDTIIGGNSGDCLVGGPGNDVLLGGTAKDILLGGPGNDDLRGGNGKDLLIGGPGDDVLEGDNGTDVLDEGDEAAGEPRSSERATSAVAAEVMPPPAADAPAIEAPPAAATTSPDASTETAVPNQVGGQPTQAAPSAQPSATPTSAPTASTVDPPASEPAIPGQAAAVPVVTMEPLP